MASLGQELKRERELRGISLKEIADSTRISLKFLQAIEEDDLAIIPGSFFIRAILRSYARAVGLDEHQVLNRYQELQSYAEESQEVAPEKGSGRRSVLTRRSIIRLAAAVLLILIGFLLFFLLRPTGKNPGSPVTPLVATPPPSPAPLLDHRENEPAQEVQPSLTLELSFVDETWLQVFSDGVLVFEGIKKQGESLSFSALREFGLNLGNAGGLTYLLNGKKGRPFGPPGAVRKEVRITLENYEQFLSGEKETPTSGP